MKSRSEILRFIFYTCIFIPVIIFILEITFLLINKSNTKFSNGTKYDSLNWLERKLKTNTQIVKITNF